VGVDHGAATSGERAGQGGQVVGAARGGRVRGSAANLGRVSGELE